MKRIIPLLLVALLLSACGQKTDLPTWEEQYDLGIRYLSEGNYEEAIIAFASAIEIDPKQAPAYVGRGNAYIGLGETEENFSAAFADYEVAIQLDESNVAAYLGLADVYIRQGEYEKAAEILQQGLEKTGGAQLISDKIAEIKSGNITDSSGKARRETTYDGEGVILCYIDYTYNIDGKTKSAASYDAFGSQTGYAECTYDADGHRVKGYYKHHESNIITINPLIRTLDAEGREIRSDWYRWNDGSLKSYTESDYDVDGNRIEWRVFESNGTLTQKHTWKYSLEGIPTDSIDYHYQDGVMSGYEKSVFDSQGNEIEQIMYNADGSISLHVKNEYDSSGNLSLTQTFDRDGQPNGKTVYEYDGDGNLFKETSFLSNGEIAYVRDYN